MIGTTGLYKAMEQYLILDNRGRLYIRCTGLDKQGLAQKALEDFLFIVSALIEESFENENNSAVTIRELNNTIERLTKLLTRTMGSQQVVEYLERCSEAHRPTETPVERVEAPPVPRRTPFSGATVVPSLESNHPLVGSTAPMYYTVPSGTISPESTSQWTQRVVVQPTAYNVETSPNFTQPMLDAIIGEADNRTIHGTLVSRLDATPHWTTVEESVLRANPIPEENTDLHMHDGIDDNVDLDNPFYIDNDESI